MPVGLAMMSPSALIAHHRLAVDRHRQLDDARERALRDDHVVQHDAIGEPASSGLHRHVQHHPLFGLRGAVDGAFERRKDLRQRHLGEKPEAAEVDAENRNVGVRLRDAAGRAEQRAVATEHDDHVDLARAGRPCRRCRTEPSRPADVASAAVSGSKTGVNLPLFEPRRNFREVARRPIEARFRDTPTRASFAPVADHAASRARGPQMEEELAVAGVAGDRRFGHGLADQSYLSGRARRLLDDALLHGRIANRRLSCRLRRGPPRIAA